MRATLGRASPYAKAAAPTLSRVTAAPSHIAAVRGDPNRALPPIQYAVRGRLDLTPLTDEDRHEMLENLERELPDVPVLEGTEKVEDPMN